MHGFGAFYFGLPRLADQLLYRWHSGYSPFARRLWAHERGPCSSFFCAKRVRITQIPHRSLRSWERRGGFSRGSRHCPDLDHFNSEAKAREASRDSTCRAYRGSRIACQQPQKLRLYPCKSTRRKPRSRRLTALRYPAITRLYYEFSFSAQSSNPEDKPAPGSCVFSRIKINIERLTNVRRIFTSHLDLRPAYGANAHNTCFNRRL